MGEAMAIQRERMPATNDAARQPGSSRGRVRRAARQPRRYTISASVRTMKGTTGKDHAARKFRGTASAAISEAVRSSMALSAGASMNLGLACVAFDGWIRRWRGCLTHHLARRIAGRGLVVGVQGFEETHQGGGFGGRESTAVGGHVAAAQQHLADQLIFSEARGHIVECGAALSAESPHGVAVAALLFLEHIGALALKRRAPLKITHRHG